MSSQHYVHNDYSVAWICPLEVEQTAAIEMLDQQHPRLPQPSTDNNSYILGSIQDHNVVIGGLPTTGNCSAATVVAHMKSTFPRLRFGLLVGIGGGVPTRTRAGPIKLGDVVVSEPTGQHSGAIQYDRGKAEAGEFHRTGSLAPPPNVLLHAARRLAVIHAGAKVDPLQAHLQRIDTSRRGLRQYRYPGLDKDHLYQSDYLHRDKTLSCQACGCDSEKRLVPFPEDGNVQEKDHGAHWITIHRGTIASGESEIRDGKQRDELAKAHGVLCFEMETAGALNDFPCLVIRGISDYADSHQDDEWQSYAAAAAAAYARELFYHMPIETVAQFKATESSKHSCTREIVYIYQIEAVNDLVSKTGFVADEALFARLPEAENASFDSFYSLSNDEQMDFIYLKGTRTGVLQQINQWITAPPGKPIFWLSGAPGTGKVRSSLLNDICL